MSDIRPLSTDADFAAFANLVIDAYSGVFKRSYDSHQRLKDSLMNVAQKEPAISFWGLFRALKGQKRLLGGMRLFDFKMNFLQTEVPVGAVGQVAVALEHRNAHVAKELMLFYLRHYRGQGTPLAALYPFRPDFYRNMGFGYGTKMSRYRLDPRALPFGPHRDRLRRLGPDDREGIRACYTRYTHRTHGMIHKIDHELDQLFDNGEQRIIGYERDGQLRGYLVFTYERGGTFLTYDLHVRELIYETPEALSALLTFLRTQDDQIQRVVLRTQDCSFHHLFDDPRNDSDALISPVYHPTDLQGVGIMYRVIDVPRMFNLLRRRDFSGQTCRLQLRVQDTFLPENACTIHLAFDHGRVQVLEGGPYDVAAETDIASFSSLLAGTVSFERLYFYSLAELSDPAYLPTLSQVFSVARQPMCTTSF